MGGPYRRVARVSISREDESVHPCGHPFPLDGSGSGLYFELGAPALVYWASCARCGPASAWVALAELAHETGRADEATRELRRARAALHGLPTPAMLERAEALLGD